MPSLPSRFAEVILTFAPLFLQQRTWDHAGMLLIGAILAPGQRTVTSLLRIMGLSGERRFVNYHRVLNRAVWSSRAASRLLLAQLSQLAASEGQNACVFKDGGQKVFTTERGRERGRRAVGR